MDSFKWIKLQRSDEENEVSILNTADFATVKLRYH